MPRLYKAKATVVSGVRYRSAFEASVARDLSQRRIEFGYEELTLFYTVPHVHKTDFTITKSDGTPMIIEAKGYFSADDRRKTLAVLADNEDIDYRFLFQNAKLRLTRAKRSSTYGQWCNRHNIRWAEGTVPGGWLLE